MLDLNFLKLAALMRSRSHSPPLSRVLAFPLLFFLWLAGCDSLLTEPPSDADIMDGAFPELSAEELGVFARGDAAFERSFAPSEGLGPIFNNSACGGCHSGDGRGGPENILTRIGVAPDFAGELGGPQIQDRAIPGATAEFPPPGVPSSLRLPPPVFGVGLIEAIRAETILALADPDDRNRDGISGRPNWVRPGDFVPTNEPGGGGGLRLGRFSRKAQVSSLLQQVVEAYHQDMGITTDFLPVENSNQQADLNTRAADHVADPEIPASEVEAVLEYIRMLAPPAPGVMTDERLRGRDLFGSVGCARCHVPSLPTGPHRIGALDNTSADLYSDLLLHDMGEGLADDRPDGDAGGREWRTAPLWGLRVMRDFLAGDAFLLHDGRARTVEEAILEHGGEAEGTRGAYSGLDPADQAALLDFVESR